MVPMRRGPGGPPGGGPGGGGPGGPQGVVDGDGAAVDVDLVPVPIELAADGEDLAGERLVDLDQVEVVDGHAGALEELLRRGRGTDAHDGGIDADGGGVADGGRG